MANDTLTEQMHAFCREYVKNGGNATNAYIASYNCENSKQTTIGKEAYRLKHTPKIRAQIQTLIARDEFDDEIEFNWIANKLNYIANRSTETVYGKEGEALLADARAAIAAVQELNKMRGNHAPVHSTSTTEMVHGIADVAQAKATLAKHGL